MKFLKLTSSLHGEEIRINFYHVTDYFRPVGDIYTHIRVLNPSEEGASSVIVVREDPQDIDAFLGI